MRLTCQEVPAALYDDRGGHPGVPERDLLAALGGGPVIGPPGLATFFLRREKNVPSNVTVIGPPSASRCGTIRRATARPRPSMPEENRHGPPPLPGHARRRGQRDNGS